MRLILLLLTFFITGFLTAQPANDDCAGAVTIISDAFGTSCTSATVATTVAATPSSPVPSCNSTAADDDIWYSFTAASQSVLVRVTGAALVPSGTASVSFEIYGGTCGALNSIECNSGVFVISGNKIVNGLTIGNTYYLRFWSTSTVNDMTFNFCVQTVPPPPVNDDCAGAITIFTQPFGTSCAASVSANTSGATHSSPDPSCGVADSNDDIWYSFTANSQSVILRYSNGINTITGSTTQGLGYALYNSSCPVSTATVSCLNAISVLGNGFRIIDGLTIGNTYYLRLFSDNPNNYMSFNFCVQDVPAPPVNDHCTSATPITTSPFGSACTSSISANTTGATHSTPDPSCGVTDSNDDIWYSFTASSQSVVIRYTNGQNTLTGSTTQGLGYALYNGACPVSTTTFSCLNAISILGNGHKIIDGLTIGNTYYLRLFSENSNNYMSFDFCVQDVPPPPANDECASAIAISTQPFGTACAASISANTTGSTHSTPDPSCGVTDSNDDIWYSFTANSQSVVLRFTNGLNTTTGSGIQGLGYALYNASCPAGTATFSCNNAISTTGNGLQIIDGLTIGNTYFLRLYSDNPNNYMSFDFCVQDVPPAPSNNECAGAIPILLTQPGTVCASSYNVNTTGATQSSPNPSCTSVNNNDDLWYSFTASAATAILRFSNGILTTTGGPLTLGYAVYNAPCPASATTVSCSSGFGGGSGTVIISGLTAGNPYYLRLFSGGSNNYGAFNFCIQSPLLNDDCANAINLPVSNGFCNNPVLASLNGATTTAGFGIPSCGGTLSRDVWFKATIPSTGNLVVQTSAVKASANNTVMVAFTGTCGSLTQIACDNDGNPETGPSANHSRIALTGRTPGEIITYRVLAAFTSSEEQFAICAWDTTSSVLPPVASGANCIAGASRVIDSSQGNIYMWVPLYNTSNEIIAEVYPDGSNFGTVNPSIYLNTGAVRQTNDTILLDRNVSLTPENALPGRVRIYFKTSELASLQTGDSTVAGAANLRLFSSGVLCGPGYVPPLSSLSTSAVVYTSDFYLEGSSSTLGTYFITGSCKGILTWNGSVSTSWHDPGNWDCSGVPWRYNAVVIPSGMPRYPIVSSGTEIKSIDIKPGASVTVSNGVQLKMSGQ